MPARHLSHFWVSGHEEMISELQVRVIFRDHIVIIIPPQAGRDGWVEPYTNMPAKPSYQRMDGR